MGIITIKIPYPAVRSKWSEYGDNAYYSQRGGWYKRKHDADYWHDMMEAEAPWNRPPLEKPVIIRFYWDDKLDLDNHSIWSKMLIDGIKKRIIKDDNRKCVVGIEHRFHTADHIKIEIEEV